MKNIYIKILAFIIIGSFMACEDLNEEVFSFYTQENYLINEQELRTQAYGLYDFFPHSSLETDLFSMLIMPNKYYASRNRTVSEAGTIYSLGASDRSYELSWEIYYRIIGRANILIKYADNALQNETEERVAQYKAEAYFFRAYCYFNLVRIWGKVPLHLEPVESNNFEQLNKPNAALEDIYSEILSDLDIAKQDLPLLEWDNSAPGRIRAATAIQLQGLVHLTMAGKPLELNSSYQLAIDTIEELTDNEGTYGVGLLDNWMDNFNNDIDVSTEKLFSLASTNVNGYGSGLPRRITPPGQTTFANAGAFQYAISYELYELFEPNDVRRTDGILFSYTRDNGNVVTYQPGNDNAPSTYGGDNGLSHLKYTDGTSTSPTTHINESFYMRYVESYLILAESYNEIGNATKALEFLNKVRERVNASEITVINQSDLRQIIRDERNRELFHEYTELFDMRRWGTEQENFENHPLILKWNQSIIWNERFSLSPIPLSELSRNSNLEQNIGW